MGQQLPVELGREGHVEGVPEDGAARAWASLAADFSGVGDKIGQLADHATAVAGKAAGEQAGLDPEFRPKRSLTIYGEAFDKAGLNIHKTQMSIHMLDDMAKTYDANKGNPAGLAKALTEKRRAWIGNAVEEIRPELTLEFDKQHLTLMREAVRAQHAAVEASNKEALQTDLTASLKRIQQRAYGLGLDPKSDEVLASDVAAIEGLLGRNGLNGKPLVNPAAAAKIVASTREAVSKSRLFGAFSRLPTLDEKAEFIKKLEADFAEGKGAAKDFDLADFDSVSSHLKSEYRQAHTAAQLGIREAEAQIKMVAQLAEKGLTPQPDDIAALKAQAATIADAKLSQNLDNAIALLDLSQTAKKATPAELDAAISKMRGDLQTQGAEKVDMKRLNFLETLSRNMHGELAKDPIGWVAKVGLATPAPLDVASGDGLAKSIAVRVGQAEEIAGHYSIKTQYLRPDEKTALTAAMAKGGQEAVTVMSAIARGAGDRAPVVLAEISKHGPATAQLGHLVAEAGEIDVVRDAADGLALRGTPDFASLAPSAKVANAAAQKVFDVAYARFPATQSALIALANAVYDKRARQQGVTEFDEDLWGRGLRELTGEQTVGNETYGGLVTQGDVWAGRWYRVPIVLPANMSKERWRDAVDMLQLDDLKAAGLGEPAGDNGSAVSMERLKSGYLVQVGNGRFRVALGGGALTPGSEKYVTRGGSDKPFILDFRALEPILSKRRPDLFLARP